MPYLPIHLKKEYDTFLKQQPQQIVDTHTAPAVLIRALTLISAFSGNDFHESTSVSAWPCRLREDFLIPISRRLTFDDKQTQKQTHRYCRAISPLPPVPHVHSPECRHRH